MNTPRVLASGRGWVAISKPPGVLVIPGRSDKTGSLREQTEALVGCKVWVVHRLDKDTSGAVLFATDADTHRFLSHAFETGAIRKRYVAVVRGDVAEKCVATFPLVPARRSRMRVARPGEAGKASCTEFAPLERWGVATWLEAAPLTGRQHQIRVHLAALGHPLWVDPQYGDAEAPEGLPSIARTPLHADTLSWRDAQGNDCRVASPLPDDLSRLLDAFRSREGGR